MVKQDIYSTLGMIFLGVLLFVGGFYFGYKYHKGRFDSGMVAGADDVRESVESLNQTQVEIITKELEGVYWIGINEVPICPQDHPIKAKYDGTIGFYYMKSNNSYDRVKPALCFATEEFARDTAGFIRKY